MKKYLYLLIALVAPLLASCSDDDDNAQSATMTINKIYLEDVNAKDSVFDREVTFARLGQLLRIEGSGFTGLKKIYVNGYETYFNNALMTDNNIWVTLNAKTPVDKADESVRNTIVLVKDATQLSYSFIIRAAAPSITSLSNSLPMPGEKVIAYGANLQETTKVTLPGGVEVTSGIVSDEDGEWFSFTMPSGVSGAGTVTSEGANGTAVSPDYFNDSRSMILNFDGMGTQGYWSWSETGSMINNEDLVNDPLASGRGKVCQLIPQRLINAGGVAVKGRGTEVWTAGNGNDADDWSNFFGSIPATTPLSDLAFQFDVYVPEAWSGTGQIQITANNNVSFNGYGSDEVKSSTTMTTVWVPWLNDDGSTTPFKTDGWQTVTIPLTQFSKYANEVEAGQSPLFQELVDDRNAASYKNFGVGFVNNDITVGNVELPASVCSQLIYVDNFRLVFNRATEVSDY